MPEKPLYQKGVDLRFYYAYDSPMKNGLTTEEKIAILMGEAADDREGERPGHGERLILGPLNLRTLSDRGFGKPKIFRILLTNACAFSCSYCPMRAGRSLPRHVIAPEKLAEFFIAAVRRGWANGLFLTSGIPKNPSWAMDRMIQLVELIRFRHRFAGYVHAKAVSGAPRESVERLALLVDRLSFNLESACQQTLDRVAPQKSALEGVTMLRQARDFARHSEWKRLPGDPRPPGPNVRAGATSQIVVGIGEESDREILQTANDLWKEGAIHHMHFAAFRPIADTPMENEKEVPALREQRLYQAEYLVRLYGFAPEELVFGADNKLPLSHDPKMTWALAHPEHFPLEITRATPEQLRRVPGLGRKAVERIVATRRTWANFTARDLSQLGPLATRAAGFLAFRGKRLRQYLFQQSFWTPEELPAARRLYAFSPGTFR